MDTRRTTRSQKQEQVKEASKEEGPTKKKAKKEKTEGQAEKQDKDIVIVNRAPVLTLWGACLAKADGWKWDTALTIGSYIATMLARSKGKHLGLIEEKEKTKEELERLEKAKEEAYQIHVGGFSVLVKDTDSGTRAMYGKNILDPNALQGYLQRSFKDKLEETKQAMDLLASSLTKEQRQKLGYSLYESFRPEVPPGVAGWGRKGRLDLAHIREMAHGNQQKIPETIKKK